MVELQVLGVTPPGSAEYPTVIMRHEDRVLFISIGPFEAAAIAWGMKNDKPARPMTHDLILNILAGLRGEVKSVTVYKIENGTFFAYLLVEQRGADGGIEQVLRIDTRPSDGIAIAVRAGCPIYAAEEVMDEAGRDFSDLQAQADEEEEEPENEGDDEGDENENEDEGDEDRPDFGAED
jgi:bifunctional DNase/RNase